MFPVGREIARSRVFGSGAAFVCWPSCSAPSMTVTVLVWPAGFVRPTTTGVAAGSRWTCRSAATAQQNAP